MPSRPAGVAGRTERRGPTILTTPHGPPMDVRWIPDFVGESLRQGEHPWFDVSPICAALPSHGWRWPTPQIATFTGHNLRGVGTMLDAIDRDVKLAEIATMKLETRTNL